MYILIPRWPEECCYDYVKSKLQDYNIYYNVSIADFHIVDFGDVRLSNNYVLAHYGLSDFCKRQIRRVFDLNVYFNTLSSGVNQTCTSISLPLNNNGYK